MSYYKQGDRGNVIDFIFPIITVKIEDNEFHLTQFLGTGFLIGKNGFGLTCAHVIENHKNQLGTIFNNYEKKQFVGLSIDLYENHPTEDVSIIHISNPDYEWRTPFLIKEDMQYGWLDYLMGGYPEDVVWERKYLTEHGERVLASPDLVSVKGHIRRRVSRDLEIPGIRGTKFYELSTVSGRGCSGSPVFNSTNGVWTVSGIYSAEKRIFKEDSCGSYVSMCVAYSVRSDSFYDWKPACLNGKTIKEESQNYTI